MKEFFAYVRRTRKQIIADCGDALTFCRLLMEDSPDSLPSDIATLLLDAEPDERDYAIASAYSLLIGETRRSACPFSCSTGCKRARSGPFR
jgi:hypothetical protein